MQGLPIFGDSDGVPPVKSCLNSYMLRSGSLSISPTTSSPVLKALNGPQHLHISRTCIQTDDMSLNLDFDLELQTLWYTTWPPKFPVPSMRTHGPCTSTYTWSMEQSNTGTVKTLVCAVLFTDTRTITKVRVTFDPAKPTKNVRAEQKHCSPPKDLDVEDLDQASKLYGANIARWCEQSVGTTVGDGECWSLIHLALQDLSDTYAKSGLEPPLISQGRTHGYKILSLSAPTVGSNSGLLQLANVRPGDILELGSAHFQTVEASPDADAPPQFKLGDFVGQWKQGPRKKNVRLAYHTAVIVGIEDDIVRVVEQNGSAAGVVAEERYDLGDGMVKGTVEVWRVVGEGYIKGLNADWDD